MWQGELHPLPGNVRLLIFYFHKLTFWRLKRKKKMETYTSSGTFCDMWLFRKASSKFPHPESGSWTTGSLSFTTSCNFRSSAPWQRQIHLLVPWRIHCAMLCAKFWKVMLSKLVSCLKQVPCGSAEPEEQPAAQGKENNMAGQMPRIPSWTQRGKVGQVREAIPKHSQTSLGCIQRNIPTVISIAVYGTGQKTHRAIQIIIKK